MDTQKQPQFLVFAKRKNSMADVANLYLKVTYQKESHEKSLGIRCAYADWNCEKSEIISDPVQTYQMNQEVETFKQKFLGAFYLLRQEDHFFTLRDILDVYSGSRKPCALSFCQTFQDIISRMERLRGADGASVTNIQKHRRCLVHFQRFCWLYYKTTDVGFQKFNQSTIEDFLDYLKAAGGCSNNTAMKYLMILKKVYRVGIDNSWVKTNAFANFKFRMKTVDRGYLTETELEIIRKKKFNIPRLELVRDIFIFSCFTGLAYIDVKNLRRKNLTEVKTGYWIKNKRAKTGIEASIPLLPPAMQVLNKYRPGWKSLDGEEILLNPITNQKMNAYLKEVADLCGLRKVITFHLARHTFATTVTLSNNIPMETVSKMLGHSRISMTQHYSKVVDLKIERDTYKLAKKFK